MLTRFSKEDLEILRGLIARERSQERNRQINIPFSQLPHTQDIYIAGPPSDTSPLAALDPATGVGTDTQYRPSYTDCYLYRIVWDDDGPFLQSIGQAPVRIFNITPFPFIDHEWITVKRDKFGNFIADMQQGAVYTGKTTAAHALNAVQSVDLYEPDYTGTLQDIGISVNARNRMEDIPNADQVVYLRKNPSCYVYDIISANPCPSGTGT